MPTSSEVIRLVDAHRQAQSRLSAVLALLVMRAWRAMVRTDDIDTTSRLWLEFIIPRIVGARARSAALAATYANTVRQLETGDGERVFTPNLDVVVEQIRTSLAVTGPVALRRRMVPAQRAPRERRQAEIDKAFEQSAATAAAAAIRHVRNGGRETVADGIRSDRRAIGQVRVPRADCCYFCAMLAGRGPVYKEDSFSESDVRFDGPGEFKVHDSCGCELKPVFRRDEQLLDQSREFDRLWRSATRGKSGQDAINAFRRAYEGRAE